MSRPKKLCNNTFLIHFCDIGTNDIVHHRSKHNAYINSLGRSMRDRLKHNRFDPVQQERG